jgi:hypothetical protein
MSLLNNSPWVDKKIKEVVKEKRCSDLRIEK